MRCAPATPRPRRRALQRRLLAGALVGVAAAFLAGAALLVRGASGVQPAQARTLPAGGYETVAGDDWRGYADREALKAAQYFWWFDPRDVYGFVDLVPDATFGRALRITFPRNTGSPGSSPRMARRLPHALDDLWLRWKMRYQPGWTTDGPDPAGSANSYKIAFLTWEGAGGRAEIELSNGTDYITGVGVQDGAGRYAAYGEVLLPGADANFGRVTTEWSDGQWWEFVIHYRRDDRGAVVQYWRRRFTTGGRAGPGPWTYHGVRMRGPPGPRAAKVELGANKNKNNPQTMYLFWGPWEVVDGARYPDPFGVPGAM
ncbi:MAG TPA: hypothetical protein VFJ16_28265 [Longimicrobium sp.]|nr:hypothetical protein [Longimicrobium sp.]